MKTMKTMGSLILAVSLSATTFAVNLKVDEKQSTVKWLGKKVTGEHNGTITIKEGSLIVDGSKIIGGKVVMDMQSIKNLDLTDAGYNAKLIGHLKSDDFFSVETYPTSELVITKDENSGNTHVLTGNLTIKGTTNPVTFTATSAKIGLDTVYKGTLTIDRSNYNVRYGSKSFFDNLGDKVIYDEFTLDFNLIVSE